MSVFRWIFQPLGEGGRRPSSAPALLAFFALFFLELASIPAMVGQIGFLLTMVWLAADVALGSALIARVGYAASLAAAAAMSSGGREPYAATLPLRLFLAGALFAFPGFASDAAAVFVLLPVSTLALRWAAAKAGAKIKFFSAAKGGQGGYGQAAGAGERKKGFFGFGRAGSGPDAGAAAGAAAGAGRGQARADRNERGDGDGPGERGRESGEGRKKEARAVEADEIYMQPDAEEPVSEVERRFYDTAGAIDARFEDLPPKD